MRKDAGSQTGESKPGGIGQEGPGREGLGWEDVGEAVAQPAFLGLRSEIFCRKLVGGGLALFDPLFERLVWLSAGELERAEVGDPEVLGRLDGAMLRPCAGAERALDAAWWARLRPTPLRAGGQGRGDGGIEREERRGKMVAGAAAAWRRWCGGESGEEPRGGWGSPERWRRLLENGRAGQTLLELPELFPCEAFVDRLIGELGELRRERLAGPIAFGERAVVPLGHQGSAIADFRAFWDDAGVRAVVSEGLGRGLGKGPMILNFWVLSGCKVEGEERGDHMRVHPDGGRYAATLVLGLNRDWKAEDGGGIVFGPPGPDGLSPRTVFLPHRGDVAIFAPHGQSFHGVQESHRERLSLSGWWGHEEEGGGRR